MTGRGHDIAAQAKHNGSSAPRSDLPRIERPANRKVDDLLCGHPSLTQMSWLGLDGETCEATVPDNLAPVVAAIGYDKACAFFLKFGGAPMYISRRPQGRSGLVEILDFNAALRLGKFLGAGHWKVPVANDFIARHLRSQGVSVYKIARTIRAVDKTVRALLRPDALYDEASSNADIHAKIRPSTRGGKPASGEPTWGSLDA